MKAKSKKFTYGHFTRGFPYEDKRHPKHDVHYTMMEGFQYLIHLPDGSKITGIFHKKGLGIIASGDNQYATKSLLPQQFLEPQILLDQQNDNILKVEMKQNLKMCLDKGLHSEVSCPLSIAEQTKCQNESSFQIKLKMASQQQSIVMDDLVTMDTIQDKKSDMPLQLNSTKINQSFGCNNNLFLVSTNTLNFQDQTNHCKIIQNQQMSEKLGAQQLVYSFYEKLEESCHHEDLDVPNIHNQNKKNSGEGMIPSVESTSQNDSFSPQIKETQVNASISDINKLTISGQYISKDDVSQNYVTKLPPINIEHMDTSILKTCNAWKLEQQGHYNTSKQCHMHQMDIPVDCVNMVKDHKLEFSLSENTFRETSLSKPEARTIQIQLMCDKMNTIKNQYDTPPKVNIEENINENSNLHVELNNSVNTCDSQTSQLDSNNLKISKRFRVTGLFDGASRNTEISTQSCIFPSSPMRSLLTETMNNTDIVSSKSKCQQSQPQKSLVSSQSDQTKLKIPLITTPIRHSPYKMQSTLSSSINNLPKMLFRLKGHNNTLEKLKTIPSLTTFETSSGHTSIDAVPVKEEIKDLKLQDLALHPASVSCTHSLELVQTVNNMTYDIHASTSFVTPKSKNQALISIIPSKNLSVSVCTVAPTTSQITTMLVTSSSAIQRKSPIFISPHFKALADICRQSTPKATALVAPNTHMKPIEDEVHVLSSDDEDVIINQSSRQNDRSEDNFILRCPLRQAFFGASRGGTFRVLCLFLEYIRLSNISSTIHLDIPLKEVNKIYIHHGLCGPVFFLKVSQEVRRLAEFHFSIDLFEFDPLSTDLGKSQVLLIPSKKNDVERDGLGQQNVTTGIETVRKHVLEKFGHNLQVSVLNGGETSELIGLVLHAIGRSGNRMSQTPSIVTQTPPSMVSSISSRTGTSHASTSQQLTSSFVIVGGNQPINILGSNHINITNNIFNINVSNNGPIRSNASTPNTQIIFLSKKLANQNHSATATVSSDERAQQVRSRGPIMSLFTYPPTPGPGRMTITSEDYYCLNEGELLNDNIIDFYLKYFIDEHLDEATRNNVHLFSSFFYGKLVAEHDAAVNSSCVIPQQGRHSRVKTWTRHVDLFEKDFVIIPIIESSHWFLSIICFPGLKSPVIEHYQPNSSITNASQEQGVRLKQSCILIFDSLGLVGHQTVTKTLREYLQEEWNQKKQDMEGEREFSEQTFPGFNPSCPQQNNSTDCGVFVLKYVESFFKKPIKDFIMPISNTSDWFTHEIVREKRKEIQDLIMKLHDNDPNKHK